MARPRKPLISRRGALEAALRIIDSEGLDSLSIRGLGDDLGVNGASLYHHFANKEEIVVGATQLALSAVVPDIDPSLSWRTWLPETARRYRQALAAHPNVLPVIVRKRELGMGLQMLETAVTRLLDEGVPSAAVLPLLDAIELFVVGSALHEADSGRDHSSSSAFSGSAVLVQITNDAGLTPDEIFDLVVESIIEGIERAIDERLARWTPKPATAG